MEDDDPINIDLIWEVREAVPPALQIHPFMRTLLRELDVVKAELALVVTDDAHMRTLNARYRDKDTTTDVLSFPAKAISPPEGPHHLGDIVISYPQALRQAAEIGHSPESEVRFLCLHGTLHLLGFDHETDNGEMLERQRELKSRLNAYF